MCPCNKSEQSVDHMLYECDLVKKERKNYTYKANTKNREVAMDEKYINIQVPKTVQKICRLNRFRKTTE